MKTLLIISALAFVLAMILGFAEGRHDAIKGTDPDHSKDFKFRLGIGSICAILIVRIWLWELVPFDDWWLYDRPFVSIIATLFMLSGLGFIYGFFLDITFNLAKGHQIDYIGKTAKSDQWARENKKPIVWMKLLAAAVSLVFYFGWVLNFVS